MRSTSSALALAAARRASAAGLGLGGAVLDLLEPLRRRAQGLVGPALVLGEALLGVDQLAGELLLLGAVALELVLGPRQLGEQRLALRLVALGLRPLALLGRAAARLGGGAHALLGLAARPLDPLLGLALHPLDVLGAALGLGPRLGVG